jgi:hypothetical protein
MFPKRYPEPSHHAKPQTNLSMVQTAPESAENQANMERQLELENIAVSSVRTLEC